MHLIRNALRCFSALCITGGLLQVGVWQAHAQVTKTGTTLAQFLKINVAPRGAALGDAFVAVANDVSAIYWNVAGLARLGRNEFVVAHTNWIADVKLEYSALVIPLGDIGTIGGSITALTMGEMDVRTVDRPEGTGERFGAGDLAVGFSYARNLTDRFSFGLTAKYVNEYIWHMGASGFGVDVGTLYQTGFHGLTIGMSISNFGAKMRYNGNDGIIYFNVNPGKYGTNDKVVADIRMAEWDLPLIYRVGVAIEPVAAEQHRLKIAVDALHPNDNTESVNVGAEYVFDNVVSLRTGYKALFRKNSEEGLTLGAGIAYSVAGTRLKADYGWADFGRLKSVHRFGLGIEF